MKLVRLLGKTTLDQLQRAVESTVTNWLSDWSLNDRASISVCTTAISAESSTAAEDTLTFSHSSGGRISLCSDGDTWHSLLFPNAAPRDTVATELVARSRSDLATRLFSALGFRIETLLVEVNQERGRSNWRGSAHCLVSIAEKNFILLVDETALSALDRAKATAAAGPLSRRADAITVSSCTARITLDLGELPLHQLQSLAIGDTLLSDTPLSHTFSVEVGNALRLSGRLGRTDQSKAIYLIKP